jgi:hypothetical protein
MLLLIISYFLYLIIFNQNKYNILIFTIIFSIIYIIEKCYTFETFEIINIDKNANILYNNQLFEYGKLFNKSYLKIKPIKLVFNFINNLSYDNNIDNKIDSFLYPYTEIIGAQITNVNYENNLKIQSYIKLINNYGIILDTLNNKNTNMKHNIIAYGIIE